MPDYDHPTSPGLDAVMKFVNTAHHEQGVTEEDLDSPAALDAFIAEHALGMTHAGPRDLRRALDVREALRNVMGANNGFSLDHEAVATLNRAASRAKVVAAFDDNESWRIEPASNG